MAKPYTDYIHPVLSQGGIHKTNCHPPSTIKMAIKVEIVRRDRKFLGSSKAIEQLDRKLSVPEKFLRKLGLSRWGNGNR